MKDAVLAMITSVSLTFISSACLAQESEFESNLRFESGTRGSVPRGWGGGPPETIFYDAEVVYKGKGAVRIERNTDSSSSFSTLTQMIESEFEGNWIELSGFLRTENVTEFVGLWLREDGPAGVLRFDNMQRQNINGTMDWTEYKIRLPLDPKSKQIYFGVLIAGNGKVWADELQLLVDGSPIKQAPKRVIETTVLESDNEFDLGTGIQVTSISETQTENVAVLGMVWGFLKYHHPRITGGDFHWDYEFFRILPKVFKATDRVSRNQIITRWVTSIGFPEECKNCVQPPRDLHLEAPIGWIYDTELLGSDLSNYLRMVYENRLNIDQQFYVTQVPVVGNPEFSRELPYRNQNPPDTGFRILALMRFWNIIEYWFPYRNQIDDDWHSVLREFLPRVISADDWDSYRLEMLALICRVKDTHANLWSALDVRPPRGECHWPIDLQFVEGKATVTGYTSGVQMSDSGLEIGDVIESVDGQKVDDLVQEWSQYYCVSNETTRLRDIARFLPRGNCEETSVTINRDGKSVKVALNRVRVDKSKPIPRDRGGETFQLLSPEVAYLKLSSIRSKEIPDFLERASGTRGLVIDIRNYPSDFVVFALGSRLIKEPIPFARFTKGELSSPGVFSFTEPLSLTPQFPVYEGKVAVIVNEVSISQAEYTAMALRAGPEVVVVGSTTAGADGNVSSFPLPGGLQTMISGIGVFYPDKTPTQRVGIIPDIEVTPTINGIREGRDEVLEEAVRYILGPDIDEKRLIEMTKR